MDKAILAIESSCDDTAIAIVDLDGKIIWENVFSQDDIHGHYGGVVPEIASRNHIMAFQALSQKLKKDGVFTTNNIVTTGCTAGPGLVGGLISGIMLAKGLSQALNIPIIAVNHLEGHLLSPKISRPDFTYPFLALLISGGHSEIVIAEDFGNYRVIGKTLDDAAGEAFDKIARLLGLGYPGGKKIEEYAKRGDDTNFLLPMAKTTNPLDFSFSGLKTAALHHIRKIGTLSLKDKHNIAATVQKTITDTIYYKLEEAIKVFKVKGADYRRLSVCGGVAANISIRAAIETLCNKYDMDYFSPPLRYCTDNAVMIGIAAVEHYKRQNFSALSFPPRPIWSLNEVFRGTLKK